MANTPKWNIRLRHEWLATPLKKKRLKLRAKRRLGYILPAGDANQASEKKS